MFFFSSLSIFVIYFPKKTLIIIKVPLLGKEDGDLLVWRAVCECDGCRNGPVDKDGCGGEGELEAIGTRAKKTQSDEEKNEKHA
jgi:hypothetical protein